MGIPTNIKVGVFVILGLFAAGLVTFLVGDQHGLFAAKKTYYAEFEDIQGLGKGAPVRMGGLSVGSVARVGYSDDLNDTKLHVEILVYSVDVPRVREDTRAKIENKGLLGDKMIVLTVGDPKLSAPLPPGSVIPSEKTQDLSSLVDDAKLIVSDAKDIAGNLKKISATLADSHFQSDLRNLVKSLNSFFTSVDSGDGYIPKLLHSPEESLRISRLVAQSEVASGNLAKLLGELDVTARRINTGPGLAHSLFYGHEAEQMLGNIAQAADQLALTLHDIREGHGLANAVLFGDDDDQQLMGNLNQITADAAAIMNDIRAGKGTVGALLMDPSVYEDIKILLGNVSRNRSLRALVRYSIEQDEKANPIPVVEPDALIEAPASATP